MSEGEWPNVAGFEQLTPVAEGGFGSVYRAVDEHIGRVVAIKVLDKVDTTDARARDRFLRETRAMGTLSGLPHIVDIYQATFTAEGRPCIVMPYLAGGSLGDVLRARGRLSPDEVITLGATIARALESAHRRGISHRDIKPENILIDEVGDPGLADFGIAMTADSQASTRTRLALSPEHAPPERLNPPTGTTPPETLGDIYSLASTLYTLLAGRTPFGTEAELGSYEFIKRVVEQPPPPITSADVNPQLQTVLDKALAKDPYSRYATALELATALETIPHTPTPISRSPETIGDATLAVRLDSQPTQPPKAKSDAPQDDAMVKEHATPVPVPGAPALPRPPGVLGEATAYRDPVPAASSLIPEETTSSRPPTWLVAVVAPLLLVAGILGFIVLHRSSSEAPRASSLDASTLGTAPAGTSVVATKDAPVVDEIHALSSGGFSYTWTDPSTDGTQVVQVFVDGDAASASPLTVDQATGDAAKEQLVTEVQLHGAAHKIEPASHEYCVVMRHLSTSGSVDSASKCLPKPSTGSIVPTTVAP